MATKDDEIISLLTRMMDEQREHRSENAKSLSELDKKVDLHIQKTEYELEAINKQDAIQNQLLDQHIAGVQTLRAIHEEHVKENNIRFSRLEKPRELVKLTTKIVLWLGGLGTATLGIMQLINFLKGL